MGSSIGVATDTLTDEISSLFSAAYGGSRERPGLGRSGETCKATALMGFRFLLLFASFFSFLLPSSGEEISLNLGPFRGLEVNRPGDGVSDLKI